MRKHYPLNPSNGLEDASLLPWENGNASTGVEGSYPPFSLFTDPEASILTAQAIAGLTAADDPTQLAIAMSRGIYLGTFGGSTNGLTATIPGSIALPSFIPGVRFGGNPAFTNTGAVSIGITGLTPTLTTAQLLRRDGTAIQAGDIVAGVPFTFSIDTSGNFRLTNVGQNEVQRTVASATFYIRTDGNDGNNGSANDSAHAFATLAGALAATSNIVTTNGQITYQLGIPGTYAAPPQINRPGGNIRIPGDATNQNNYIIAGAGAPSAPPVSAVGCAVTFSGVTLSNTGTVVDTLGASTGASITIDHVTFQSVGGNNNCHIAAYGTGAVVLGAGLVFSSSMGGWLGGSGSFTLTPNPITFTGTPNWSVAGVQAILGGIVNQAGTPPTIVGSATGARFLAVTNGVISTNGSGINYFPGSTAGSASAGGQYV